MKTVAETIRTAAALIEPPGAWTTGAYARNADGLSVDPRHHDACCWCALGAIRRVTGLGFESEAAIALRYFIGGVSVVPWNDYSAQADVVTALRACAEAVT